jgi:hypothetical protein
MSDKWKKIIARIAVAGGLVGWVVTMLGFFGIDWGAVTRTAQLMTTHYILGISSVALLAIAISGIIFLWRNSRVTPDNVEGRLRGWLEPFGLQLGRFRVQNQPVHFTTGVTDASTGFGLAICRSHDHPQYLTLLSQVRVSPQDREFFDQMTETEKTDFGRDLALQGAYSRIDFFYSNTPRPEITVRQLLPITSKLKDADVIAAIQHVQFSTFIFHRWIEREIAQRRNSTQPLPIPDMAVSQPSPAS